MIKHSDIYSDTSGSLWQFKKDEAPINKADLTIDNSQSFKYKAALVGETKDADGGKRFVKNTNIVVPLKYLNNFWRSLEMQLINCKFHLQLNWTEDCILSSVGNSAKLKLTDAKLHAPIFTLSTKDNVNLKKQLSDRFKRSFYWNNYRTIPARVKNKEHNIYELLSASFQGIKGLFVLAYVIAAGAADNEAGIKTLESIFFREKKLKIMTYWLMKEIFMINQLMI